MINRKQNDGFSYIEVLIASALLIIIITPVFSGLHQAQLNNYYSISRRTAQGFATTLTHEVRAAPGRAAQYVEAAFRNNPNFSYRATLISIGTGNRHGQFISGDAELMPPFGGLDFRTDFSNLFTSGTFVVAEVFDNEGNLAGFSVAKIN